ncbi:MAG: hypothetical protein ACFFBI_06290 [Promethearchaeota archaeon]
MERINYQVWLRAVPLKTNKNGKEKSDIIFSTDLVNKALFKIFDLMKSEVFGLTPKAKDLNPVRIIFNKFCDYDIRNEQNLDILLNNYIKELMDHNTILEKASKILIDLRKKKIQFWEKILEEYLKDKEKNSIEIMKLWGDRRVKLNDF